MKTITYNCDACGIIITDDILTIKHGKNIKHFCSSCGATSLIYDLIEANNVEKVSKEQCAVE